MSDQHERPRYAGGSEQVMELGHHLGGVARHRRRVTAPWKGRVGERERPACVGRGDHRARPVVDADPVGFREGGKHGGRRCVGETPDVAGVPETRLKDHGGTPAAPAFQKQAPPVDLLHQAGSPLRPVTAVGLVLAVAAVELATGVWRSLR